jgi:glutamate synthase (ferredoxin)
VTIRHDHAFDPLGLGHDSTLDSSGLPQAAQRRRQGGPPVQSADHPAAAAGDAGRRLCKVQGIHGLVDNERPHTLRGLLEFVPENSGGVPLEEVEPASDPS